MGFIHHECQCSKSVYVQVLHVGSVLLFSKLLIYCYQNSECGPSFKPSVHRNYMLRGSRSSLSRSNPCVNIQCSDQIYQAVLTRAARQPANSHTHTHLTVFVFRNREVREGEHKQESGSLCKALAYPNQCASHRGGVHFACIVICCGEK